MSKIEDLPNEIFYKIFDYLDFDDVNKIFSKFNQRFANLINDSDYLFLVVASSISKKKFDQYYKNTVLPNVNRIKTFYLFNLFVTTTVFSSIDYFKQLKRLRTLVLNSVDSQDLANLHYLTELPALKSLVLITKQTINNPLDVYKNIFSLKALQYCKLILGEKIVYDIDKLSENHMQSPIKRFVIGDKITLLALYYFLSCMPKLQHLTIVNDLLISSTARIENLPKIKNRLTHVSMKQYSISVENWQLLLERCFTNNEIKFLPINTDETTLTIHSWHNPELNNFYLRTRTLLITKTQFPFIELIQLLNHLKNIEILKFHSLFFDRTKIERFLLDEIFENVAKTNRVTTIKINGNITCNNMQLIIYVFSRMKKLNLSVSDFDRQLMLECLLSKTNKRTRNLCMLTIQNQNNDFIQEFLQSSKLLRDFIYKNMNGTSYIWW